MSEVQESNVYAAPETDVETIEFGNKEYPEFHLTGTVKVVVFYVLSFGFYSLIWFYQQWRKQKNAGFDCWPVPRAIFAIIFCYSLFSRVKNLADDKMIKVNWSAGLMTVVYILVSFFGNLIEPLLAFFSLSTPAIGTLMFIGILLIPAFIFYFVQRTINRIYANSGADMNEKFTALQWVFVVFGVAFWGLMIFGLTQEGY